MTDIPEDIRTAALSIACVMSANFDKHASEISQALLSERRKQIERDAKIVEGFSVFPGREAIAAAIRAQEPKA